MLIYTESNMGGAVKISCALNMNHFSFKYSSLVKCCLSLFLFLSLPAYIFAEAEHDSEKIYGTTIITHGFQFGSVLPDWVEKMAEAILERAGKGNIWFYNTNSGQFDISGEFQTGEQILIYDWADASNNSGHGYSEAAGDSLFAALVYASQNNGIVLDHLHFIGHSRGTVVNSEACERLIKSGQNVEHVTTLDPVWNGALSGWEDNILNDHDVNQETIGNQGVVVWNGIKKMDNYYSDDDCNVNTDPFDLDGERLDFVSNQFSQDLTGRGDCEECDWYNCSETSGTIDHSSVHAWYYGTIKTEAENNGAGIEIDPSWYGEPYHIRSEDGYWYSRIADHLNSDYIGYEPIQFDYEKEGLVNGDFERGKALSGEAIPGWDSSGGGGSGRILEIAVKAKNISGRYLELKSQETQAHSYFYLPENMKSIDFDYATDCSYTTCENNGSIQVHMKEMGSFKNIEIYSEPLAKENHISIPLAHTDYSGKIVSISINIPENNCPDLSIMIDNVQLVMESIIFNTTPHIDDTSFADLFSDTQDTTNWYRIWVGNALGNSGEFVNTIDFSRYEHGWILKDNLEALKVKADFSAYTELWVGKYNGKTQNTTWSHGPVDFSQIQTEDSLPTKVSLVSPTDQIQDSTPSFTWNVDPFSTWYRLWVGYNSKDKIFAKWYEASEVCLDDYCSVTPDLNLNSGIYQWYIKAWNKYGEEWSDGMSFIVTE